MNKLLTTILFLGLMFLLQGCRSEVVDAHEKYKASIDPKQAVLAETVVEQWAMENGMVAMNSSSKKTADEPERTISKFVAPENKKKRSLFWVHNLIREDELSIMSIGEDFIEKEKLEQLTQDLLGELSTTLNVTFEPVEVSAQWKEEQRKKQD